jgi:hypothetical protein
MYRFIGHSATTEDVCFRPTSGDEFCSVGDDQLLIFWDERKGKKPVNTVPKWLDVDLHCVGEQMRSCVCVYMCVCVCIIKIRTPMYVFVYHLYTYIYI